MSCGRWLSHHFQGSIAVAALLALTSCATTPRGDKALLEFLDASSVTRDEVSSHLGDSTTYENGRIWAFRLGENRGGYYVVAKEKAGVPLGWNGVRYNLIVEFDEHDTVQNHHLIAVRDP